MYKLTNQNLKTHNGFKWKISIWYRIPDGDRGKGLCSKSWFHCYSHPLLAVFFNPIHANVRYPRLFRVNVKGKKLSDSGIKYGYTMMKLTEELPVPEMTPTQRITFAILYVKQIYKNKEWGQWADNWLSGKDRSYAAADAAAAVAVADAAVTADAAGAYAAVAAADAAAAVAVAGAYAAVARADVATAAAVADVAVTADAAGADINLIKLVKQAVKGD